MEGIVTECPYVVGNEIALHIDRQQVKATIAHIFEPFTFSCAMVVLLDRPSQSLQLNGHMVLKLYDRRFATGFREDQKSNPWTPDIEQQYQQFVLNGDASNFVARLDNDDGFDETYLYTRTRDFYETEIEVYVTLKDIQGEHVPKLFTCVTLHGSSALHDASVSKYTDIPGILLEYIDGFPLTDQSLCEQAINIIHQVGDRGILNEGVKTRSFVIQKSPERRFKMFMLDFALCKFRRDYESEKEWWEWKAIQDEEGAVGYIMRNRLQGGFVYHRSALYTKLDDDYKSEN
ncbi:hypothetical protein BDV37DRAFT_275938 [Aspergillus pseudonomiae]|uniref:Protein kinase domain-containing protein n=1 Tax=Aspergillus pseudonomiae TaxID=1506151 RepID=A0A5N7CWT0_9EURO|nr:uncharacterized protein BDV37DRAFT_275938 [Aspergillus pseudonomiae]KAE8398646.1 hypothetical protein BDV37DRAFT_275938 [Aspergillus pseudonomiae]